MTNSRNLLDKLPVWIISLTFLLWSAIFISNVSFTAIDGRYYVNLFDDAMISMRYAWNLSHGIGLVWNPGEYVEGYTNLLMTLVMALVMVIVDDKRLAVFIIHLFGIVVMLGIAYTTLLIAGQISRADPKWQQKWLEILTFVAALFYYPLTYWTLMGMETGLLTLLILLATLAALNYTRQPQPRTLFLMGLYLGLASITRPDGLIAAVLIFLYVAAITFQRRPSLAGYGYLLAAMGLCGLFVIGQQIFRVNYYGEFLPNTYYLKATGMPLPTRIRNGILYIIPFLKTTLPALLVMALGLILNRHQRQEKLLLVYLIVAYLYYQVWIGGDAFPPYWRLVAPVMPLVLLLAIQATFALVEAVTTTRAYRRRFGVDQITPRQAMPIVPIVPMVFVLAALLLVTVNLGFWPELTLWVRPYEAKKNEYHINTAIAINQLTTPEATIGVTSAGTVPYYSDNRVAIDFLGKSDKYIAHLPPDLSGATSSRGMISLPGHNKYDLDYSIKKLQPTYVQTFSWGQDVLLDWAKEHYTTVEYHGVTLYFLNNSPAVLWDKVNKY